MTLPLGFGGATGFGDGCFVAGGAVYSVSFADNGSGTFVAKAWKSTSPTTSWSVVGGSADASTNVSSFTFAARCWGTLIGTKIYVAIIDGVNGTMKVTWFDTTTDTWTSTVVTLASTGARQDTVSLTSNNNGDLAVAWGTTTNINIAKCTAANLGTLAFGSTVSLTTTASSPGLVRAVGGSGGRFHVFASVSTTGYVLTLNAAGTAGTVQTLTGRELGAAASRDAGGGVWKVAAVFRNTTGNALRWVYGTSADSLSATDAALGITSYTTSIKSGVGYVNAKWRLFYNTSSSQVSVVDVNDDASTVGSPAVNVASDAMARSIYNVATVNIGGLNAGYVVGYTITSQVAAYDQALVGTPPAAVGDTVTLTDTAVLQPKRTAGDTVGLTDALTTSRSRGIIGADTVTVSDSTSVSTTQGTLTTPVALGPGVFLFGSQVTSWRNPAETVTIADTVTSGRAFQRTAAQTVTVGDTATRASTRTRAGTGTVVLTDQAITGAGVARTATGAVTLTDNATGSLSTPGAFSRTAAHTIHLADTATRSVSPHGSIDPPTTLALSGYVSTLQIDPNVTTLALSGYVSTLQIDPNVTTLTLER